MRGRYRGDTPDLIERILQLERRLSKLERAPQLGSSSVDEGTLLVVGSTLTVSGTDGVTKMELDATTTSPKQKFVSSATPGWHARIGHAVGFGFPSLHGTLIEESSNFNRGGLWEVTSDAGFFGHKHLFNLNSGARFRESELVEFYGKLNATPEANSMLFAAFQSVSAGVSSVSFTYPVTMATAPYPIVSIKAAAANFTWCVTAYSTTGFTVSWSDTTAKDVMALIVRSV